MDEGQPICIRDYYGFKERIAELIEKGEYRDTTDFIVKAIKEKLEPGSSKVITRRDMIDLMRTDPTVQEELRKILASALAEKLQG